MVPSIQLKTVPLAQMASASISPAVIVNPGLLRSCRKAKRKSWSSPVMDASSRNFALGEKEYCRKHVHAVRQNTCESNLLTDNNIRSANHCRNYSSAVH